MKFLSLLFSLFLLAACAASHPMPGAITHALSSSEAEVYTGGRDLQPGEQVSIFKRYCAPSPLNQSDANCQKVRLGNGRVKSTRKNYSIVEFDKNIALERGVFVEHE